MRLILVALVALLAPAEAHALWQPGGNRIGVIGTFEATASGGRVVLAWTQAAGLDRYEVRAQAWTADGDLASGWPSEGVAVGAAPGQPGSLAICEDGAGGVFVAWVSIQRNERTIVLQRLSTNGDLATGWAPEGLQLGTSSYSPRPPVVSHDGAGGVLVGWSEDIALGGPSIVRVHRIDAGGVPNAVWPAGGHTIPDAYDVGLVVDDEHHAFVSTGEYDPVHYRSLGMRVRRLAADATPDPEWPEDGALVSPEGSSQGIGLIPDGAGGVFAGWSPGFVCIDFCPPLLTTRVLGNGTVDDRWQPAHWGYSIAADGTGGMLLGTVTGGRPGVLRLGATGEPMPGWAREGNAAMTEVVGSNSVHVSNDGQGGAFVLWSDWRTGKYRLYASKLDAAGRVADGWPVTGSVVDADRAGSLYHFRLVNLGVGVVVAIWDEWSTEGLVSYMAELRPGEPGPIVELGPTTENVGLGVVRIRPNPARGPIVAMVELPSLGAARVDLIDAAGRVLESQDFNFLSPAQSTVFSRAGFPHPGPRGAAGAVRFNQARQLRPGVYWVRVTQGSRQANRKVILIE